jgi:arabinose-5-phosphate isomerase
MDPDLMSRQAGEVMTTGPRIIRSNALAAEALALMNRAQITSLFVLDDNDRPQGILHIHDCLRAGIA